ncbi:glycoside hydrolase family 5 protein [Actinopolymorpha pittospori]
MDLDRRKLLLAAGTTVGGALLGSGIGAGPASAATARPDDLGDADIDEAVDTEAGERAGGDRSFSWNRLRGMSAPSTLTDADVEAFAATGGNLLRLGFAGTPLMRKTAPFDLDQEAFARLDTILDACERHGVHVVIDPHTFPGLRDNFTTFPDDEFWQDLRFHDLAHELWDYIAARYKDRGSVVAGYDLLNEPAVPDVRAESGPASWNALALGLVATVRAHDPDRHILIGTAISPKSDGPLWYSRFESVNALPPPPDARIVVTPHMYAPHAFTHQGVQADYPEGVHFPGTAPGQTWEGLPASVHWDRAAIREYLRPALDYQRAHHVPVFVGEFSTPRWIGMDGNRYLRDTIEEFERLGWSWTYHAWREWEGWDAELSNDDKDDLTRYPSTPRLELLKHYFSRNGRRRPRGQRL